MILFLYICYTFQKEKKRKEFFATNIFSYVKNKLWNILSIS